MTSMKNCYLTGDTHGQIGRFKQIKRFCKKNNTSKETDVVIILGDAGLNYYENTLDVVLKEYLNSIPITFICIQGNHEQRPENIATYKEINLNSLIKGSFYYEPLYDNIYFAKNSYPFFINGLSFFVLGGAYSVDKEYRLNLTKLGYNNYKWFQDEQLNETEKTIALDNIKENNYYFDYILTHTCPYKYRPTEMFLPNINQKKVDNSMEIFLDKIDDKIHYKHWYCGHWHTDKNVHKISFLFKNIEKIEV